MTRDFVEWTLWRLAASDCNAMPQKQKLQQAWEAAHDLWMGCLNETSTLYGYDVATLQRSFRIQDCDEYLDAAGANSKSRLSRSTRGTGSYLGYAEEWAYLRYLEENHFCGGWCTPRVQLWSHVRSKDSCSNAVADVFGWYVQPHAAEVCSVMVVIFTVSAIVLVLLGPIMRKSGFDW